MKRFLAVLVLALAVAPAAALAVTNTFSTSAKLAMSRQPSSGSPAPLGYRWTQHADTNPPGLQPDRMPSFSLYFPDQVSSNRQFFPFCSQAAIDGRQTFPEACRNAIVGYGTASMLAGSPGQPSANSVKENLDVRVVNGNSGNQMLLVLNSQPAAPVAISNRVIPGYVSQPGFIAGTFSMPEDLQQQLGLTISLTDLSMTFPATTRALTVNGTTQIGSYFEINSCPDQVFQTGTAIFRDAAGADTGVTAPASAACEIGFFDDPFPPTEGAALAPPEAGKTANVQPATPCDTPDGPPVAPENCASRCPPSGCTVRIRVPGSNKFVTLDASGQIPIGATVDTTAGAIRLTSAGARGTEQTGIFYGGVFKVGQARRKALTELALPKPRLGCARSSANRKRKKQSLWGNTKGSFRTRGNYAAGTALGTKWLVEDRCDSTLVRVTEGRVSVRDFPRSRTVVVRAGRSYVARARRR